MLRSNLARPVVRMPVSRRSGMPRGPGGLDEVILDVSPGIGGVAWSSDPWGWPDELNAYRILDWRGGDGVTPTVGPVLTLTGATTASKSPATYGAGTTCPAEFFDGSTYYTAPISIAPGATQDVVYSFFFIWNNPTGTPYVIRQTAVTARNILYGSSSALLYRLRSDAGDTWNPTIYAAPASSVWLLVDVVVDRGGNRTEAYLNGVSVATSTVPPGTFTFTATDIGIVTVGSIARVQAFRGVGIGALFTDNYARHRASAIFGLRPKTPTTVVAYTRTGAVCVPVGSDVYGIDGNTPRTAPLTGLSMEVARTNKCYKNSGLLAGDEAYITVSAGLAKTTRLVDLRSYGIYGQSERVYEVTNATGSDGYITSGATAGSADVRSVSVRGNHEAGAGCEVGLYEAATPTWTSGGAVADSYARTHALITPGHNNQTWAIKIPDGCTFRFALQCNTLSPTIAPEIPNLATAAAAAIGASSVNWGVALPNYKAAVQAEIAPDGWNSGDDLGQRLVLSDSVSAGQHMVADDINGEIAISDGTNAASEAIAETDGNYQTVYTGWGPRGIVAEVAATQDRDSYDGAIGAGNAVTGALNRWLRRLRIVKAERM